MGSRMYSDYFGIKENAFSITPDPRYLYMSERHREAFAHLLYGAVENSGFVQLTGEVGTGKTTICRAFLDQLPENVDVALLLSPPETPHELLLAIISELHIALRTHDMPLKALVDRLNEMLLTSHAKGRRTVVIIDEAQNIRPEVLEQVRLLTNLETRTAKLLQVFLIGQPELREQLTRPSLRQVAQRITARYHLEPLSRTETEDYIRHRLAVAGCRQGLFSVTAIKQVFQESEGIPRVINILCDRALLGAFANDKPQVDAGMVRYAAQQWRGARRTHKVMGWPYWSFSGVAVGLLLSGAVVYGYGNGYVPLAAVSADAVAEAPIVEKVPIVEEASNTAETALSTVTTAQDTVDAQVLNPSAEAPPPAVMTSTMAQVLLAHSNGPASLRAAEQALLQRWQITTAHDGNRRLCDVAARNGLRCRHEVGGLRRLRDYNRPAVLTLVQPDGTYSYGTVVALDTDWARLEVDDEQIQVSIQELGRHWNGEFVLLWEPPLENTYVIGPGSPQKAVIWLRHALDRAEGERSPDRDLAVFDYGLQSRLRAYQARCNLVNDGVAGVQTLTYLLNVAGELRGPVLTVQPPIS